MKYIALTAILIAALSICSFCSDEVLPAQFTHFTDEVEVWLDGDYVVIQGTGIPNHPSPYFPVGHDLHENYSGNNDRFHLNPNRIRSHQWEYRIPLHPKKAKRNEATPMGPMGVSLNGVAFFNQYSARRSPLTREINSFDQYNGHPQMQGEYHYHIEPLYLTQTEGKDALLGFLLDGFPVYGPEENGVLVTNSDLDELHGHSHATKDYPDGIYHYHITDADPYINGNGFYGQPGTISR
jgi:hypothetical protein